MNSKRKSSSTIKRRLGLSTVYNKQPIHKIKQFFDEVERIKSLSKTKKQNSTNAAQRMDAVRTHRLRQVPSRRASRPLPEITFRDIFKSPERSCSRSKNQAFGNQKIEKNCTINTTPEHQNPQSINYYKRLLLPRQQRILLESRDVYLAISRMQIQNLKPTSTSRIQKRTENISFSSPSKRNTKQLISQFGRFDTPWNHHRSFTNDL